MKLPTALLLGCLALGTHAAAEEAIVDDDDLDMLPRAGVVQLGSSSFEHLTQAASGATTGDWFVKFYAPWCGHCKKLAPTWHTLAAELTGVTNVATVDCTQANNICRRFDVRGYPTLLLFSHGTLYTYNQRRDLESLKAFALGGFRDKEGEPVPQETWLNSMVVIIETHLTETERDIRLMMEGKQALSKKTMPTIGAALLVMLWAVVQVVRVLFGSGAKPASKKSKVTKKKKKT